MGAPPRDVGHRSAREERARHGRSPWTRVKGADERAQAERLRTRRLWIALPFLFVASPVVAGVLGEALFALTGVRIG